MVKEKKKHYLEVKMLTSRLENGLAANELCDFENSLNLIFNLAVLLILYDANAMYYLFPRDFADQSL